MEIKKNPKYELEGKRPIFFSIGMIISLSLSITAFEWKTAIEPIVIPQDMDEEYWYSIDEVHITKHDIPKLPKAPKKQKQKFDLKQVVEDLDNLIVAEEPELQIDDIEHLIETSSLANLIVEEAPFEIVEQMPEFPGGEVELLKLLDRKTRYPRAASNMGIQGRVYVQFVVEKDGSVSEIEVVKGIGAGCDQEALRVMHLVPAFKPGKQRGKPVRVKMIIPISFKLE